MAESNQLDVEQILIEAQHRWLRPAEICEILRNYNKFTIAPEPANMPRSGSIFLYDRKVLRYFRKDGHNWRKKKDGKTVKEAHERLKAGSVDVLQCYYCHGEENEYFQRRSYWMLEEELSHIVLVHYLEVKGTSAHFKSDKDNKESLPHTQQTEDVMPNTEMDSCPSSSFHRNSNQVHSQTKDTASMNSAQASEYEEAESAVNNHANSEFYSFLELQQPVVEKIKVQLPDPCCPLLFTQVYLITSDSNCVQDTGCNSLHLSSQPVDSVHPCLAFEVSSKNCEQEINEVDFQKFLEQCLLHPYKQNKLLMRNDPQDMLLKAKDKLKSDDLETSASLDGIDGRGLKKLDGYNQWMSKELGEVEEPNIQSTSGAYWDTVECENGVDSTSCTTIHSQVHLDTYLLDPSISHNHLFRIIDFSPSWTYEGTEIKVLVSGKFLRGQHEAEHCKWSCMFGEVEVPAEIISNGVLRCHTPPHKAGRVPFYVTCSNRLACSEVREFDFRVNHIREVNTAGKTRGSTLETFHMRFGELLSLGPVYHQNLDPVSVSEKYKLRSKISSLLREKEDDWEKLLKLTLEKDFSPENLQEQMLQKLLKDKLLAWLLQKITEDGKGPNVLDEGGQGVLHFAAALGYDWVLEPTIVAGVNVNFRDVNGWTALHWAAFCGRERTVASLISHGAAPGALTDPCPGHPSGRTPADIASANGHKGIAGYLAESTLSAQLLSLDLSREGSEEGSSGAKVVQRVQEQDTAELNDEKISYELSLKDSLAAVRNATEAAARIHQVFRVQSFQRKQLKEYGDDKFGISDEHSLSLIAVKSHKAGQHDEPVHAAAIQIQNKFRSWKGRKEFLIIRRQIVKIQAHVRGHQVRKNYGKIVWCVGILEKVILRWRRKGSGLRGFKSEAIAEGSMVQDISSKEDDYDFLKEGRKQAEERLDKALARVKSMVKYPEARDQYHRLLNVVTEIHETQVKHDMNNSEETSKFDDLVNLEAFMDEDAFMPTTAT